LSPARHRQRSANRHRTLTANGVSSPTQPQKLCAAESISSRAVELGNSAASTSRPFSAAAASYRRLQRQHFYVGELETVFVGASSPRWATHESHPTCVTCDGSLSRRYPFASSARRIGVIAGEIANQGIPAFCLFMPPITFRLVPCNRRGCRFPRECCDAEIDITRSGARPHRLRLIEKLHFDRLFATGLTKINLVPA